MLLRKTLFLLSGAVGLSLVGACAHTRIPGTQVEDTAENRVLFAVVEKLREALEARSVDAVMALVSPRYYEDMGTADPVDDYGYEELKARVLPETFGTTKEMQVAVKVDEIVVEDDKAHADIRYDSRARIEVPGGTQWDVHKDFSRIEFVRDADAWKIVRGL